MISNYKSILADFGLICYNHKQIKSFAFGDMSNVTTQITGFLNQHLEPEYIRVYIVPGPVTLEQSQIRYNFSFIFMDRLEEDLSNQIDVLSDTLEVAKDFYSILLNNYQVEFGSFTEYYDPEWGSTSTPFLERFETVLAGHTLSLDIIQPFEYKCDLPLDSVTLPDEEEIYNVNYKQIVMDILGVGNSHQQLNSVGFGDIHQLTNDIVNHIEPNYARMYVVPDETIFNENEIQYNFNIIISDRLEEDLSNQRDVLNDTLEICKDIAITFHNSEYYTEYNVIIDPFLEEYDTVLAGWTMKLRLNCPYRYDRCESPLYSFERKVWSLIDELWNKISKFWNNL